MAMRANERSHKVDESPYRLNVLPARRLEDRARVFFAITVEAAAVGTFPKPRKHAALGVAEAIGPAEARPRLERGRPVRD